MSGYLPAPPPVSPFRTSFAMNSSGTTPRSAPPAINEAHHPTQWDRSEIRDWLESIKCGQYSRLFEDNHITGDLLLECDQDVLKDMGIKKVGDRIRISQALKALRSRSRLSRSGSRRRREKSLQQLDKESVSPFVNGTSSSPIDGYFSSKNRRANPRQPTSAPTSSTKLQEATKRDGESVVLSKQNTVKFIYLQGQSKTVNISGCYTARQIKLRALKKINIEDEGTVDSWTVYVADNELGTTTRALSDDELTNICRSQRFSEKRRLIICPGDMLPSLKQLSKSQQILRSSLNSTDSTMPKLEDDEDEDLTDEEDLATVFPDQYRGPGDDRLSDRRPPSEFISSNLAHFFPEAATQELEKTVRNSIRFSKRMSRMPRLSRYSRASIASSLALGIPEDAEEIPPVPQMPDMSEAPPIPSNPPPPPPVPKEAKESKEEEVEKETLKDERLLRRSILTRRFRDDDSVVSKRQSIMPISKRASVAFSIMDTGSSSDEGDNNTATLKLESVDGIQADEAEEVTDTGIYLKEPEEEEEEEEEDEDDDEEDGDYSDYEVDAAPSSWLKGKLIGSGSFGTVYLGMNSFTGEMMAVKQVELPSDEASAARKTLMVDALKREMDILRGLQHENIVQYLGSNSEDNHLYIFLEYVPGGSIASKLIEYGEFNENLVRTFVRQILQGLSYLHGQNIIHRDIKGANILVDLEGGIKISDFGISKKIETKLLTSRASMQGSVYWMAPEVVKKSQVTVKADIWSLGCLIIEMFSGQHPFPEFSQIQALFRLGQSQGPTIPPICSDASRDLLEKSLAADYNERPSAAELLKHEFLKEQSSVVESATSPSLEPR